MGTSLAGDGWVADRFDLGVSKLVGESVPEYPAGNLLNSVDTLGMSIRFEYDLADQPKLT